MLHYESAYTPAELVEKVNAHKGEITIHSITNVPVLNDMGLPELAFIAFFTVKAIATVDRQPVPLEQRRFIGQKPPTPPTE